MGWWLLFAVFLYVACAALIVAEVFIPSGGVLSLCALGCLAGGVAIFFRHSATAGWVGVIVGIIAEDAIRSAGDTVAAGAGPRRRDRRYLGAEPAIGPNGPGSDTAAAGGDVRIRRAKG